jgi:hypothetical protein
MESKTYNPFPNIGKQYVDGLDFVINNLPAPVIDSTFQVLNDTVVDYLESLFNSSFDPGPSLPPVLDNLVYSILPNVANSYQNGNLLKDSYYNKRQILLIGSILGAVKNNSIEGILSVLGDAENEIAQSGLSSVDQAPLFVAVEVGKKSFEYWQNVITTPASSWSVFLNSNPTINTANLPIWVAASMEGTLTGYSQIQQLDMGVANTLNSLGRAIGGTAAMVSAVGLSSGMVIFKWNKKPKVYFRPPGHEEDEWPDERKIKIINNPRYFRPPGHEEDEWPDERFGRNCSGHFLNMSLGDLLKRMGKY